MLRWMAFSALTRKKIFRASFLAALAGVLFFSGSHSVLVAHAVVYVPSVQALYHFNSSDLTDSSVNAYNGTNNGATFNTTSSKLGGAAVSFNTTNDFQAPSSTFAMQDTDWTVGFWVYPRANFTVPVFMGKDGGAGGGHPKQFISDNATCVNGLEVASYPGTGAFRCYISATGQHLALNAWNWVTVERQGSRTEFWVNDSNIDTETNGTQIETIDQPKQFNGVSEGTGGLYNYATWDMDEYFFANTYINTSTRDALWYGGIGRQVCITSGCGDISISSGTLSQYRADAMTKLTEGSSTPDNSVVFGATVNSAATSTVRLEVEWQPAGTDFMNVANASSGLVATGHQATTSVPFTLNHSYHWQARAVDATGLASPWQLLGPSTSSIDFRVSSLSNAASEYLNGSSSLTYSASNVDFTATDSSTIELWYRTTAPTSSVVDFLETVSSDTTNGYYVGRDADKGIDFILQCDTGIVQFHAAADLATNRNGSPYDTSSIWHYVGITKSTGTTDSAFHLYFDGNQQSLSVDHSGPVSGNCFSSTSTNSIIFGGTPPLDTLVGNLDEVRIWKTERSASDISNIWNTQVVSSSNLLGLWHFNNSSTDYITGNGTSSQSGSPIATSSTPFGHFVRGTTSVESSTPLLRWHYGSSTYSGAVNVAVNTWNALGSVDLASTTATSSDKGVVDLQIFEVSHTTGTWVGIAGLSIPSTTSSDELDLNSPYLNSCSGACVADDYNKVIVTHELGHSLGLDHSYYGNIMNYTSDDPPATTSLGSQDLSDFHFLWGGGN
jgi:hypothetical protein